MSGPYDSYNQYPAPYPGQGYSQPPYGQQPYPEQSFGPPRRADSFGPPQQGGFQHGQAGSLYGTYDASNPQGNAGYYGPSAPPPQHYGPAQPQQQGGYDAGAEAYRQNQAYQASMNDPNQQQPQQYHQAIESHQFARQSSDPNAPNYDPNAPPMSEGERGLLGALGGGVGGHFLGKKANHGLLGTIGGAILGSMAEDYAKKQYKRQHGSGGHHHHHHSGGYSQPSSQWGGGSQWGGKW